MVSSDKVESDLANEGKVASSGALAHTAVILAERDVNGLITNDKFCLTRLGRLQLSWPRARGRLQGTAAPQLSGEVTHRGGEHAVPEAASLILLATPRHQIHAAAGISAVSFDGRV